MKIGVVGCAGRMGRMLVAEILTNEKCELAGGTEMAGSPAIGQDVAVLAGGKESGLLVSDDAGALMAVSDLVIDFTLPDATAENVRLAAEQGTAMVIGTTGLSAEQQALIDALAKKAPVVQAANMSVGINLLLGLTEQVAKSLGEDFDIEVLEMHHRHKVDAPSGTALALGRAAAAGRDVDLDAVSQRVRDGHTGERKSGDIGFATLRGGDVAGEHSVIFAGEAERVILSHKATSRAIFVRGAVRAALWAEGKAPGLYSMRDVLGLA
ncbi:MAG: 4-hydroxy-tetrahydrodipicolinate reductase [Rhodospirillales bacterium]|nr:4-hydroxy-tetrahydrodipicolinate reductase [Rhodospirillales bacterium]